jgi:hypothetical protein
LHALPHPFWPQAQLPCVQHLPLHEHLPLTQHTEFPQPHLACLQQPSAHAEVYTLDTINNAAIAVNK